MGDIARHDLRLVAPAAAHPARHARDGERRRRAPHDCGMGVRTVVPDDPELTRARDLPE
ncbi:hypothetical protein BCEN4_340009 [Burkholderia cenocepacia]|nr:hypothetical protein BCEN4_340009 [Burkholderia cenocepacia]